MIGLRSNSVEQTRALGRALAGVTAPGVVLALSGGLGAGKTAFVQGIGEGLGVDGPVLSPTFILVAEHEGRLPLLHADLYRLDPPDLPGLGLEEALEQHRGVAAVEWAERAPEILPPDHLQLRWLLEVEERRVEAVATGPEHAALLRRWVAALRADAALQRCLVPTVESPDA